MNPLGQVGNEPRQVPRIRAQRSDDLAGLVLADIPVECGRKRLERGGHVLVRSPAEHDPVAALYPHGEFLCQAGLSDPGFSREQHDFEPASDASSSHASTNC